jgi:hypothetical protein
MLRLDQASSRSLGTTIWQWQRGDFSGAFHAQPLGNTSAQTVLNPNLAM